MNFEFNCFDISLVGFVNFLGFYKTESFTTAVATILGAETTRNILDNKNVVRIIGSGKKKGKRRKSISLFVVTVAVRLDDIYFTKFLILFFFIFAL